MTARYALALSLNNATVKLAEEVGYEKVADLAKAAGITSVKATPAMALGAYDATPMDMAAAYTVFANAGVLYRQPWSTRCETRTAISWSTSNPKLMRCLILAWPTS